MGRDKTRRRWLSLKWRIRLVIAIVIILVTMIFRDYWLSLPGHWLVRDDHPARGADALVILMGYPPLRTPFAAELYRDGISSRILFARPEDDERAALGIALNDGAATKQLLERYEIPAEAIDYLDQTSNSSTFEEAKVILDHVTATYPEARRLVVVTSWYHTSRAHWIFEQVNKTDIEIEMAPATAENHRPDTWWRQERSFLLVFEEYLKWLYYLLKY